MSEPTSVDDFIIWYSGRLRRKKGRLPAAKTIESKQSRCRTILRLAECDDLDSLADMLGQRRHVTRVIDKIHASMKPSSVVQTVQCLRDLSEWAVDGGRIPASQVLKEDWPTEVPTKPITVYAPEEVEAYIAAARGASLRWWAFLTTLADSGRRVGEVLGLKWEMLRLDADPPHFDLQYTKSGRQQLIPLGTRLREQVYVPRVIEKLQVNETGRRWKRSPLECPFPWTYGSAQDRFEAFSERTGLPYRGFHCFRHTKATEWLGKGLPIQAVSALLGHASTQTTDRVYNHATALQYASYVD